MQMKTNQRRMLPASIALNVFCVVISLICIVPVLWMYVSSIRGNASFMLNPIAFPKEFVIQNYVAASRISSIFMAMGNSTLYVIFSLVLVNIGAFITSYFFSRYEFKGKNFIFSVYLAGMLIPLYALMVPVFVQYKILGLLNNRLALVITYFAMQMPLAIFLYRSFIDGVPRELDDAATIDGCSIVQRLSRIIFPLCRPIIGTISILTAISVWNEFAFSVILTPKTNLRTVAVAVRFFSSDIKVDYTLQFAGLCMVTLPILLLYIAFSKEIMKGMISGAVKG